MVVEGDRRRFVAADPSRAAQGGIGEGSADLMLILEDLTREIICEGVTEPPICASRLLHLTSDVSRRAETTYGAHDKIHIASTVAANIRNGFGFSRFVQSLWLHEALARGRFGDATHIFLDA